MRRINPVHIKTGFSFGIAKMLRLGQNIGEILSRLFHCCQNIITGAIEDARQPRHLIASQPLTQGLDRRNTAGNSRLKQ